MAVSATVMQQVFDSARRTLVVGLGETGLSVARWLCARQVPVAIVDSRVQPPALQRLHDELPDDVALFLGGFTPEAFERAEQIVISPGVSRDEPAIAQAIARGIPVTGDVELFAQVATAPVLAVTGSNGKSTVVTLLGAMARRAGIDVRIGGNLGTPVLDMLAGGEPDLYVLELSSFQLETTHSLAPRAAAVLNISADHLDRYPDLQSYAAVKQAVYRHAEVQVVNCDDPLAAALADGRRDRVCFGRRRSAQGGYWLQQAAAATWLMHDDARLIGAHEMKLAGRHNLLNALAALALGDAAGIPLPAMLETLCEFHGLPHRMQFAGSANGVRWYNDSKGTNVGATLAALDGIDTPVVLIAGGDGKGADFTPLAAALQRRGRGAVLIGRDAGLIEAVLKGVLPLVHATDLRAAVRQAAAMAVPGDMVLLSPACASTDMFRDYVERGEQFMQCVRELTG